MERRSWSPRAGNATGTKVTDCRASRNNANAKQQCSALQPATQRIDPGRKTLNIGIVSHTSRASMAKRLAKQVGAQFVAIDNGMLGCDGNHLAVLTHLAALGGPWSIALEDDAVPTDDFINQARAVLDSAPANVDVVSFYLGRQRPQRFQSLIRTRIPVADSVGAHWMTSSRLLHAVGYAIRTDLIPGLLEFDSDRPIDDRIGAYSGRVGYCWPSLIDHADVPTIVDHPDGQARPSGRTAWRTGTRDVWRSTAVTLTT
jgi:hypothetical protein